MSDQDVLLVAIGVDLGIFAALLVTVIICATLRRTR